MSTQQYNRTRETRGIEEISGEAFGGVSSVRGRRRNTHGDPGGFGGMNKGESSWGGFMHRRWTEGENSAIVDSIVQLRNERGNNWRGFENGDMVRLENKVKNKRPDCNFTQRQMVGRIRILKSEYHLVVDMLTQDGHEFMWDSANKCLLGDDEAWEEYIERSRVAVRLRRRQLNHFEKLCEVWGFVGDDDIGI